MHQPDPNPIRRRARPVSARLGRSRTWQRVAPAETARPTPAPAPRLPRANAGTIRAALLLATLYVAIAFGLLTAALAAGP